MSTGLTYLSITDTAVGVNPSVGGSYVFNSYDEAYDYGDWYCRAFISVFGGPRDIFVLIYTTSPNANGYWDGSANPPVFTTFD